MHSADISTRYVGQAIEELTNSLGIRETIPPVPIYEALNAGKTEDCVTIIAHYLGLPITVNLSTVELAKDLQSAQSHVTSERFETKAIVPSSYPGQGAQYITAQVLIPSRLPIYGTSELQGFPICVKVSSNCAEYPETFVAVMAHELSHVVLHLLRYTQKDNELYTDLTALILGFSDIIRKCRKVEKTAMNYSSTITTWTIHKTVYGYLSDELFDFAFDRIKNKLVERRREDKELREKILRKLAFCKKHITFYEERRLLLNEFIRYLDNNRDRKMRKQDIQEIVRVHQLHFLDRFEVVSKNNGEKLKEITESSLEPLGVTQHYTKQRTDLLLDFLQKVDSLMSNLEKELHTLDSEIAVLERNVGFLDKRRIRHQLQHAQ